MIDNFPEDVVLQKYSVPEMLDLASKLFVVAGSNKHSTSGVMKAIGKVFADVDACDFMDALIQYKMLDVFDGGFVFTSIVEDYASSGKIFKDDAMSMMRANQMTDALLNCFRCEDGGLGICFVSTAMGFLNATFDYPQEDLDKFSVQLKKDVDFYHTCMDKKVYSLYADQTFDAESPISSSPSILVSGASPFFIRDDGNISLGAEISEDMLEKAAQSIEKVLKVSTIKDKRKGEDGKKKQEDAE